MSASDRASSAASSARGRAPSRRVEEPRPAIMLGGRQPVTARSTAVKALIKGRDTVLGAHRVADSIITGAIARRSAARLPLEDGKQAGPRLPDDPVAGPMCTRARSIASSAARSRWAAGTPPLTPPRRRRFCSGAPILPRRWLGRTCWKALWACDRDGQRCGWSWTTTSWGFPSFTTTDTGARASRSAGGARRMSPRSWPK
jgi:molybdopterin-binding protein